jgi:acetoin utilization deacetylase AcuC-like enzyme
MYALYSDRYVIDLPAHHTFPIQKYRLIREQLLGEGTLSPEELLEPTLVAPPDVRLVHTQEYWDRLTSGTLPESAIRRMGLPWSEALVQRSRASVSVKAWRSTWPEGPIMPSRIGARDTAS